MNQNSDKAGDALLNLLSACANHTPLNNLSLSFDEWRAVIALARAHNVLALLFEKASEDENFTALPEYQQLIFETMSLVAGQARRTETFLSLYKQFLKVDIYPIVMKGIICRQLYGEYCDHRPSGDEDILIRKSEYERVKKVLVENGYTPEIESVTAEYLEKLQEISFSNASTGLLLEVHINPMGHDNHLRSRMNGFFTDVFENTTMVEIDGVSISTMNATDHFLFLLCHAFRHFTSGGFGIRQVLDMLLFAEHYYSEIDWNYIVKCAKEIHADRFFGDILSIGNRYLGFQLPSILDEHCPEALLEDMLSNGAFGNTTQAQRTSVQMTNAALSNEEKGGRSTIKTLFRSIFPSKAWMIGMNPELIESPWLLPICWAKRWGRFLAHNRANGGNLAFESMKISKRRIELLKKYDIL